MQYETGIIRQISFGDGSGVGNDTTNVINLDDATVNGRNNGIASISCPNGEWTWPDTNLHEFKLHVKFNTGTTSENEVNDGEFHLYIDDQPYVVATGLFNRHYSNLPIQYMSMIDYTQNTAAFTLTMDDIYVSTGDWV